MDFFRQLFLTLLKLLPVPPNPEGILKSNIRGRHLSENLRFFWISKLAGEQPPRIWKYFYIRWSMETTILKWPRVICTQAIKQPQQTHTTWNTSKINKGDFLKNDFQSICWFSLYIQLSKHKWGLEEACARGLQLLNHLYTTLGYFWNIFTHSLILPTVFTTPSSQFDLPAAMRSDTCSKHGFWLLLSC